MSKRLCTLLMVLVFFSFSLSGCYYFSAKDQMKTAEKLLSDLKSHGGEKLVPYEYCSAKSFLEMSKLEADEGDWKQAKEFATHSKSAAEVGLAQVKKKK